MAVCACTPSRCRFVLRGDRATLAFCRRTLLQPLRCQNGVSPRVDHALARNRGRCGQDWGYQELVVRSALDLLRSWGGRIRCDATLSSGARDGTENYYSAIASLNEGTNDETAGAHLPRWVSGSRWWHGGYLAAYGNRAASGNANSHRFPAARLTVQFLRPVSC